MQHVAAQTVELTRSLEHTQAVQDDHSKSLTAIQAPVRVLADRRAEPGLEHTGLIVSGVAEEVRGKDLQEHLQSLLQDEIETETPVSVCEVRRIGRVPEGGLSRPRKVLVELRSGAQRQAVLRCCFKLAAYNEQQKAEGKNMVGVDVYLSDEDLKIKNSLYPRFKEAKEKKLRRTYWRGCHLFVEGVEVKP